MRKYPKFYTWSRFPSLLSKIAPIEVSAFSFGLWVWCRGSASEVLRNHETIHYEQQKYLGFVFMWILYLTFYVVLFCWHRDAVKAYRQNPFELEAYENQSDRFYCETRRRYGWVRYARKAFKD